MSLLSQIPGADQLSGTFRDELAELLTEVENTLLDLESRPDDGEVVARLFRALHTIKGSSGMFGLTDVSSFAHALETTFEEVRKGKLRVTPHLITLALSGKDHLRAMASGMELPPKSVRDNVTHQRSRDDLRARVVQPPDAMGGGTWRQDGRSRGRPTRGAAFRNRRRRARRLLRGRGLTVSTPVHSTSGG